MNINWILMPMTLRLLVLLVLGVLGVVLLLLRFRVCWMRHPSTFSIAITSIRAVRARQVHKMQTTQTTPRWLNADKRSPLPFTKVTTTQYLKESPSQTPTKMIISTFAISYIPFFTTTFIPILANPTTTSTLTTSSSSNSPPCCRLRPCHVRLHLTSTLSTSNPFKRPLLLSKLLCL